MSDCSLLYRVTAALLACCVVIRPVASKKAVFAQLHRDVTGLFLLLSESTRTAGGVVGVGTAKSLKAFISSHGRIHRLEKLINGLPLYSTHFKTKAACEALNTVSEYQSVYLDKLKNLAGLTPAEIDNKLKSAA